MLRQPSGTRCGSGSAELHKLSPRAGEQRTRCRRDCSLWRAGVEPADPLGQQTHAGAVRDIGAERRHAAAITPLGAIDEQRQCRVASAVRRAAGPRRRSPHALGGRQRSGQAQSMLLGGGSPRPAAVTGRLRAQARGDNRLLHRAPDRRTLRATSVVPRQSTLIAVRAGEGTAQEETARGQKKSPRAKGPGARKTPGGDLLSHRVSPAVPSALEVLTSEFEMGSGVSPPV